jgi:hypothetical protein
MELLRAKRKQARIVPESSRYRFRNALKGAARKRWRPIEALGKNSFRSGQSVQVAKPDPSVL